MSTIAFFKLSDFIREVRGQAGQGVTPVVRMEALTSTINGDPSPMVRYEVWLTAQPNGDVLAARFLTGSCLQIFASHEPYHVGNNEKASNIIRQRLVAAGFDVRSGVIEHETKLQAHGEGCWKFDPQTKQLSEIIEEVA